MISNDRFLAVSLVLLSAGYSDIRAKRVPNVLIGIGLGVALVMSWLSLSAGSLNLALQGLLAALAFTLPLYLMRGLGAGDVKLLAVIGAFLGWPLIGKVMLGSLWLGGLYGLGVLFWSRGLGDYLRRYSSMLRRWWGSGRFDYLPPGAAEPAGRTLPFVPFIAVATWVVLYLER